MLKIAVDIDGVLSDALFYLLPQLNARYGTDFEQKDINKFNFCCPEFDIHEEILTAQTNPAYILSMPEIEGARDGLKYLYDNYFVTIATSRPEKICCGSTLHWLYGKFPFHNIVFCKKKTVDTTKSDILIDDYVKNILDFVDSGGWGILFAQPWNLDPKEFNEIEVNHRISIAYNWDGVKFLIKRLENKVELDARIREKRA